MRTVDYDGIGLLVGLEVHRQLNTAHKLFCGCPTILSSTSPQVAFERKLRPTQSELGQIDPAALFEFHRGRIVTYEADDTTSCLVEMDEEPPHPMNDEAIDVALVISLLFESSAMDEVHVMRKVVIDGSNTTGFQRTSVIGLNGKLDVNGKTVTINQVSLEEDAGRKISESKADVKFHLDRLGVPLIEITTGPVIHNPVEAEKTALAIGRMLRATKKVKRGLGTVRQDLNISIRNGALIEIKGVQELDLVSTVVEQEVQRQLALLEVTAELKRRMIGHDDLNDKVVNVTQALSNSRSAVVQSSLQKGGGVYGMRLRGFQGILGREDVPGVRLGKEMAKRAGFWGRVSGIFHSDELPAYGIELPETDQVRKILGCSSGDAFILVADLADSSRDALEAVRERAREALKGVPEETRSANPDGTTSYMRPRPSAARMYPETDVPPVKITRERLRTLKANLPKMPEELAKELESRYGIGSKLADQLASSDHYSTFGEILQVAKTVPPTYVATVLTESLKSLEREKVAVENLTEQHLKETFRLVEEAETAKESVPEILKWLAENPTSNARTALNALKLGMLDNSDLKRIVDRIVKENNSAPIGKLTGIVMREVRGRADPKLIMELLKVSLAQQDKKH